MDYKIIKSYINNLDILNTSNYFISLNLFQLLNNSFFKDQVVNWLCVLGFILGGGIGLFAASVTPTVPIPGQDRPQTAREVKFIVLWFLFYKS